MNAERLHSITRMLLDEMNQTDIVNKIKNLIDSLNNVVNQPAPPHQQALATNLTSVYDTLTKTTIDTISPAWRQMLIELKGEQFFGKKLMFTIQEIFQRNQITPAVALDELRKLHKDIDAFKNALEKVVSSFQHLTIGDDKLKPGQCEIAMLVPRNAINNQLLELSNELKELSFVLNTFSEVATGKVDYLNIKNISSSDFSVFLDAGATFAACLSIVIERTVALYKQLLEIRKLRQDLQKQGVPDKRTEGIEHYANELMSDGIDKLSTEIIEKFYKKDDKERKNELTNAVIISLNKIANRIDKGYNFDVRVEPLSEPEAQEKAQSDPTLLENISIIENASKNIQFMKLEGSPILNLPESKKESK